MLLEKMMNKLTILRGDPGLIPYDSQWDLWYLTLSLLMYIYMELLIKESISTSYIYMHLHLAKLKAVSFYLLHNVSTLNQCRKFSFGKFVCKHFASYEGYPSYRWDLIRYAKG
jgi:hypothetical protein